VAGWTQTDLENVHSTSRSEQGIKLVLITKNVRCTDISGRRLVLRKIPNDFHPKN